MCKWSHTPCGLLCVVSVTTCDVSRLGYTVAGVGAPCPVVEHGSTAGRDPILCIYPPGYGCLRCFHIAAAVNSATLTVRGHVSAWTCVSRISGAHLGLCLLEERERLLVVPAAHGLASPATLGVVLFTAS